jgi:hypothetical protein
MISYVRKKAEEIVNEIGGGK